MLKYDNYLRRDASLKVQLKATRTEKSGCLQTNRELDDSTHGTCVSIAGQAMARYASGDAWTPLDGASAPADKVRQRDELVAGDHDFACHPAAMSGRDSPRGYSTACQPIRRCGCQQNVLRALFLHFRRDHLPGYPPVPYQRSSAPVPFTSRDPKHGADISALSWTTLVSIALAFEWTKKLKKTPGAGKMVVNAIKLWLCEVLLVFTYPVYYYVFTTLSKGGKTAFALLLPVIKLVMKNIIARSVVHLIDEMPEVVVFNAEVFNALFVSYCMQNSPSIWITLEIMIFDVLMMGFALRDAGNARRSLKELERRIEHEKSWDSFRDRSTRRSSTRLTTLDRASMLLYHSVKPEAAATSTAPSAPNPSGTLTTVHIMTKSFSSIVPTSQKQLLGRVGVHPATTIDDSCPTRYTCKVQQLVYAAEFLLLLNYVEVIIPLVYSIYLYVMHHLPNRDYYAQLHGMDHDHLILLTGAIADSPTGIRAGETIQWGAAEVSVLGLLQRTGLIAAFRLCMLLLQGYDYSFKFAWLHH
ncbi:hypothetical protein ON010_g775 [Phytophthora cinnamomi]|nr:hypothetical protein ON010_g775 [Phytophthora cinnamomi]